MMKHSRRFLVLALAAAVLLPGLARAQTPKSLSQRVDAVVSAAIEHGSIVGTVVLIAQRGQLIYHRAAGFADREMGTPVRENTIFRLASMSKPIVSAAALALVDAGRLRLDDPVTHWLPSFKPRLANGREPVITVRQLMTHTAGLTYGFLEAPDGPYHRAGVSDGLDQSVPTIDENLRRLGTAPLLFAPGSRWQYSLATDVLGEIVARAGEAPLADVVYQRITGPLRMTDTGFSVVDTARLAVPYADAPTQPVRMADPSTLTFAASGLVYSPGRALNNKIYPSGGGGMVGTAHEYLRFLETLRGGGRPILRTQTAQAMTRNAVGELNVPLGTGGWGFGLGVAVLKDPRPSQAVMAAGTWLWSGVYGTHFFVDPLAELSVVVMTNTAVAGMDGAFPDAIKFAIYRDS